MTREREIELLITGYNLGIDYIKMHPQKEWKQVLKDGSIVFEDFEENIENYLNEWNIGESDKDEYRKMVMNKIPVRDWGIVEDNGKTYYIMYVL